MSVSRFNSEGYHDPVVYEALINMEKEQRAAVRAARCLQTFGVYLFSIRRGYGNKCRECQKIFQICSREHGNPVCTASSHAAVHG